MLVTMKGRVLVVRRVLVIRLVRKMGPLAGTRMAGLKIT
jgi:hypothetical protein